jgi:AcrR family transcriptional regulator
MKADKGQRIRPALALAWGLADPPRRGPRPSLTLDAIVAATVELADANGIEAVSMQRVAARVGVTTMALYRYVATKDDLVFLAIDAAVGDPPASPADGEGWRPATERWARGQLESLRRHPWIARVPIKEPPIGPNQVAWMECCLECIAVSGLPPIDQFGVLNLLSGFVLGHFRLYDELARGAAAGGLDLIGAQQRYADTIRMVIEPTRFPRTAAAFAAVYELAATDTVREDFEFGLARLLDGIEAMLPPRDGVPPPSSHA